VTGIEPTAGAQTPRNVVLVLLDSLNRHLLGAYGSDEFDTPNLDRFAHESLRFNRHYAGSLPCIPARHDLFAGTLDFLWRPWGSIEAWETTLPRLARRAGVTTHLVTDHPHLFELGGENYHVDFTSWDYERGHEGDPWKSRPDPSAVGAPLMPAVEPSPSGPYDLTVYERSRTYFRSDVDFPGPRTMAAAELWLRENAGCHERFFLVVDEFDPHEPFDTPEPWASRYDRSWSGPRLIWPPYVVHALRDGHVSESAAAHLRANYGSKLSMIDHWFGRVLAALDECRSWDDTAVIVCTDHGHYLGEHDAFGKPPLPIFQTMGHIPLFVRWPGLAARDVDALTTSVDIFATVADVLGLEVEQPTHGRSLRPLIESQADSVREWALLGIWAREVHVTDGRTKYAAAPDGANTPLALWSNRWSTMPLHNLPDGGQPKPDRRAALAFMPGSTVPVIRQPYQPGDMLPYWAPERLHGSHLYRLDLDPDETENRAGTPEETGAVDLLRAALESVEAPTEQLARLGLS
jgi:arylsulfatase A-like enzyme